MLYSHGPPATILPCHTHHLAQGTHTCRLFAQPWLALAHLHRHTGSKQSSGSYVRTRCQLSVSTAAPGRSCGEHVCTSAPVGGAQALQSWSLCLGSSCRPLHYHLQDCCTSATTLCRTLPGARAQRRNLATCPRNHSVDSRHVATRALDILPFTCHVTIFSGLHMLALYSLVHPAFACPSSRKVSPVVFHLDMMLPLLLEDSDKHSMAATNLSLISSLCRVTVYRFRLLPMDKASRSERLHCPQYLKSPTTAQLRHC